MTNQVQDYYQGSLNIYGATLNATFQEPLAPPGFKWVTNPDMPRSMQGKVRFWQITIDETRGGMAQDDDYQRAYAGWSSSTCDARFRRHLILPLKTTETSGFGSSSGNNAVFWTNFNGVFVMTGGSNANLSLFKETSSSDPTPAAVTYTPGAAICSLQSVPTGGTSIRLVVGREGTTTDVHSTAGTSIGTMHTSFNSLWGMCTSPLNASAPGVPMLIGYANTGIYVLSSASAIGTAPTQTLTAPGGGAILGLETLIKSPWGNRVYMLWPKPGTTTSGFADGGSVAYSRFEAVHINDEGLDPQVIKWSLDQIKGGRLWQRRMVCHSAVRVVAHDGESEEDLRIFNNIAANSDIKYQVIGLGGDDATLLARVFAYDEASTTDFLQWWQYMPQTKSWTPISAKNTTFGTVTVSDSGVYGLTAIVGPTGPSLPWSSQTGAIYHRVIKSSDAQFDWMILPPSGTNPYNLYRQTGASARFSKPFETSGTHTFPAWTLPTDGYPNALDEIDLRLADIDGGGTDAQVLIDVATQSGATPGLTFSNNISRAFRSSEAIAGRTRTDMRNLREFFQKLQVKATLSQSLNETNKTPNALPIILRGHVCLDGIPRTYNEIVNER